jgi:hypothetical protein
VPQLEASPVEKGFVFGHFRGKSAGNQEKTHGFTTEAQRTQRRVSVCPAILRDKQKYLVSDQLHLERLKVGLRSDEQFSGRALFLLGLLSALSGGILAPV